MRLREEGASTGCPRLSRSWNALIAAFALCTLAPGCANRQLQFSTARQARTVVDLQYQQILDNLAMFCLNPSALPSLTMLKTGATQVGDTGTLGFLGVAGLNTTFGSSPTVSGTRTVVDQWGSSPMTDDNNLMLVRKAFRSALGWHDLLREDEANDLAHDLSAQIGTTADMSVDRDNLTTIYSQNIVSGVVARLMPPEPNRRNPPPGTPEAERHDPGDDYLVQLGRRLARAKYYIDQGITSTLDHVILAKSYAGDFNRRLYVELVNDESEVKKIVDRSGEAHEMYKDTLVVAAVPGGLRFFLFDSNGISINDYSLNENDPRFGDFKKKIDEKWPPWELDAGEEREILKDVAEIADFAGSLKERFEPFEDSATGLAKEAIYRVNDVQKTLDEIHPGWFRCGPEKPKDACYVGHARFCGRECYVWVCPDGLEGFEEFTRKVLKLGTTLKDVQVVTAPSGIQFAPALTNTSR